MTRSGPLASQDGRGREAVRDDVPQQVDLGGRVGAGAVAAQDVQVVEREHVGGRAGGEDRAGFGGGGEGLVDGREVAGRRERSNRRSGWVGRSGGYDLSGLAALRSEGVVGPLGASPAEFMDRR